MDRLSDFRRVYAELIVTLAGSRDRRLVDAFSAIERERFLGSGPWYVSPNGDRTPSDDAAFVYHDMVIALDQDRDLTNGLPSLHALCIDAASPKPGDTVVHVGAGTGYYTAILARLVGPAGRVLALEIEESLAARASANLRDYANVVVQKTNGSTFPLPFADVIYVNAGTPSPPDSWLTSLKTSGRLVFPLVPHVNDVGVMLRIEREPQGLAARFLTHARFYPCIGAQDDGARQRLSQQLHANGLSAVKSLHPADKEPDDTCLYRWPGWWLSTRALA